MNPASARNVGRNWCAPEEGFDTHNLDNAAPLSYPCCLRKEAVWLSVACYLITATNFAQVKALGAALLNNSFNPTPHHAASYES